MIKIATAGSIIKVKVDGDDRLGIVTDVEEAEDGTVGVFLFASRDGSSAHRVVDGDAVVTKGAETKKDVAVDPFPPSGNDSTETPDRSAPSADSK